MQHQCRASPAATEATQASLPALQPLDDDYERKHTFGDFANWLIPGHVMVGRYPYVEPSRCTDYALGEAQLAKILETGITTFVGLQAEIPAQSQMTLAGKNGFLPYKATAELIKSAMSPPPSMEVMMNLRNPTLNKFLPEKKRKRQDPHNTAAAAGADSSGSSSSPSYTLEFVHYPIVDLGLPESPQSLKAHLQDLKQRIERGEKLYVHCWGGRGRAGTVGACLLGLAYGCSAEEALERVQRAFNTRGDSKANSPETNAQVEFVKQFILSL